MPAGPDTKAKVISGLFWKLMERGGTQGVQFIVQIMLARLLLPGDYGLLALTALFIALANALVQSGFNAALIQKQEVDDADFSSVFYAGLGVALALYGLIYLAAPYLAFFFGEPQLLPLLRVMSVLLFFGAFNAVQNAIVARGLQFKLLFLSSLSAILVSGTVGIFLAYAGYGVWALVGQQLVNQLLSSVMLWFTVPWRPRLLFSLQRLKGLFSYGWKLLVASLINTLYLDLRSLIIGKLYHAELLGFFNRGQQFPALLVSNINGSLQAVLFPALSAQQEDRPRVKAMVRRSIMTSSFVVFPVLVGLAVVAEPLVKLLLTDKWLPCVPFLQIYCAVYALWPLHTANLQAINALGRSDIFLKLELIKILLGLAILGVTVFYGIYAIALGALISGLLATVVNAYPNQKLLAYSYAEQWQDIMPSLLLSLVMGAVVHSVNWLSLPVWPGLLLQVGVGLVCYTGLARIFKLECFTYLLATCKDSWPGRKGASA